MQKRGSLLGLRPFILGSVLLQSSVKTSLCLAYYGTQKT